MNITDITSLTSGMGSFPIKDMPGLGGEISTDFSKILEDIKSGGEQPKVSISSGLANNSEAKLAAHITSSSTQGFSGFLKELVTDVNDMQIESGQKTEMFIKGEPIDLHEVMIASNKARTSFQLLLELRNKGLDLYREVSRMQG